MSTDILLTPTFLNVVFALQILIVLGGLVALVAMIRDGSAHRIGQRICAKLQRTVRKRR